MSEEHTTPEVFAEALGNATVTDGVLYLDFIGRMPDLVPEKSKASTPVVKQRVVMPLPGLLSAAQVLNELIKKLEENGVIVREGGSTKLTGAPSSSVN